MDYGFANYSLFHAEGGVPEEIKVLGGVENTCGISYGSFDAVMAKGTEKKVECSMQLDEEIAAPVKVGTKVGKVVYRSGDEILGEVPILTTEEIAKIDFWGLVGRILTGIFMK